MAMYGAGGLIANVSYNTPYKVSFKGLVTGFANYTIAISNNPKHGTLGSIAYVNGDIYVMYTPTSGFFGNDSFTFNATYTNQTTNDATVTIYVNGLKPTARNGSANVISGVSTNIDISSYVTFWTSRSYILINAPPPVHGSAQDGGGISAIKYTSKQFYLGTDVVYYSIVNELGTSNIATISVTVTPPVPVCVNSTASYHKNDKNIQINVTSNISYGNSIRIVTPPQHGTATVSGFVITYTPTTDYAGTDTINYVAVNNYGPSSSTTITITITQPSPSISIVSPIAAVSGKSVTTDLSSYISGWTPNSTLFVSTSAAHGQASIINGESIMYTPTSGYFGNDTVGIKVSNDWGTSPETIVKFVSTLNAPISSTVSGIIATTSVPLTINLTNYVMNWTYNSKINTSYPSHGALKYLQENPIRSLIYTSNDSYTGDDVLQYNVVNEKGTSNISLIYIHVQAAMPTCNQGSVKFLTGSVGNQLDLLPYIKNWTSSSVVNLNAAPLYGTYSIVGTILTYAPNGTYIGSDNITYSVTNSAGTSNQATFSITILPKPPTITDKNVTIKKSNLPNIIDLSGSITNWTQGSILKMTQAPTRGIVSLGGATVSYKLSSVQFTGKDIFKIVVQNENTSSSAATITVTVV